MDGVDILKLLRDLELVTTHENGQVKISLYYCVQGTKYLITYDYIDYTDIIRIVQQENSEVVN